MEKYILTNIRSGQTIKGTREELNGYFPMEVENGDILLKENQEEFELRKTIENIERSIKNNYSAQKLLKKPFYNWYELWGWRFYLKALRCGDWRSIAGHIKKNLH